MCVGHERRGEAREGGIDAGFAKLALRRFLAGCWVADNEQTESGRHDVYTGVSTIDTKEQHSGLTMMQKEEDVGRTASKQRRRKLSSTLLARLRGRAIGIIADYRAS